MDEFDIINTMNVTRGLTCPLEGKAVVEGFGTFILPCRDGRDVSHQHGEGAQTAGPQAYVLSWLGLYWREGPSAQ